MLLVIDAGNTNTSLGVYRDTELIAHWRLTTAASRTVDEYGVHSRNLFALAGLDFKAIDAIAKRLGEDVARCVCIENPIRIAEERELQQPPRKSTED